MLNDLCNFEDFLMFLGALNDLDPGVELPADDHYVIRLGQGVDGVTGAEGTSSSPPLLHYCVDNNSASVYIYYSFFLSPINHHSMFKSHLVTCARRCWRPAATSLQNVPRVSVFADVVTVSCTD